MAEVLKSLGLDVGTTSTQVILSELTIENRASAFAVPEMTISDRRIVYRGAVHFTPLVEDQLIDGPALAALVEEEFKNMGISREDVDTGAVIITGETSRKENARRVLESLALQSGDFVVATAGPALESVLAAKGAGAVEFSAAAGKRVLHMDIGGGTANLALIEEGEILRTGCLNVGGRLVKLRPDGTVTYVSPVLRGLTALAPGDQLTEREARTLVRPLVEALEMAAGLGPRGELLDKLWTKESGEPWQAPGDCTLSFSGGVADCIETARPWLEFGDLGPTLGRAIRESRLWERPHRLGAETIRATVIGAGCHSARLSGSTVFCANVPFPLKNLPVAKLTRQEQELPPEILEPLIRERMAPWDQHAVLAMPGFRAPSYAQVRALAGVLARALEGRPLRICLEEDMAKVLGQALFLGLPPGTECLCIDGVRLSPGQYLDVAAPRGGALPVVVKTLVLGM